MFTSTTIWGVPEIWVPQTKAFPQIYHHGMMRSWINGLIIWFIVVY